MFQSGRDRKSSRDFLNAIDRSLAQLQQTSAVHPQQRLAARPSEGEGVLANMILKKLRARKEGLKQECQPEESTSRRAEAKIIMQKKSTKLSKGSLDRLLGNVTEPKFKIPPTPTEKPKTSGLNTPHFPFCLKPSGTPSSASFTQNQITTKSTNLREAQKIEVAKNNFTSTMNDDQVKMTTDITDLSLSLLPLLVQENLVLKAKLTRRDSEVKDLKSQLSQLRTSRANSIEEHKDGLGKKGHSNLNAKTHADSPTNIPRKTELITKGFFHRNMSTLRSRPIDEDNPSIYPIEVSKAISGVTTDRNNDLRTSLASRRRGSIAIALKKNLTSTNKVSNNSIDFKHSKNASQSFRNLNSSQAQVFLKTEEQEPKLVQSKQFDNYHEIIEANSTEKSEIRPKKLFVSNSHQLTLGCLDSLETEPVQFSHSRSSFLPYSLRYKE